jgi:hypothetical protein
VFRAARARAKEENLLLPNFAKKPSPKKKREVERRFSRTLAAARFCLSRRTEEARRVVGLPSASARSASRARSRDCFFAAKAAACLFTSSFSSCVAFMSWKGKRKEGFGFVFRPLCNMQGSFIRGSVGLACLGFV